MSLYYIVSLKWTRRDSAYITVWRPHDNGYAWPLSWAGKYTNAQVAATPDYYHNGSSTVAVPCEVLDAIAVPPQPGTVDNDAGPVVMNTKENWSTILAGMDRRPLKKPQPQYKGAPRQEESAA
jgi:hypothetical protein